MKDERKETDVMAASTGSKKPRLDLQLHKQHSICLVLDFGSQYTQLIARRVRENGVYSMLLPGDVTLVRALSGASPWWFARRNLYDRLSCFP